MCFHGEWPLKVELTGIDIYNTYMYSASAGLFCFEMKRGYDILNLRLELNFNK